MRYGRRTRQPRSDSLSVAFRNLSRDMEKDQTQRYNELRAYYGMTPTHNNLSATHENGSIEGPHGHLKKALEDKLLFRGSRGFTDLAVYRHFVGEVVGRLNARRHKLVEIERVTLKPLSEGRAADYEDVCVVTARAGARGGDTSFRTTGVSRHPRCLRLLPWTRIRFGRTAMLFPSQRPNSSAPCSRLWGGVKTGS